MHRPERTNFYKFSAKVPLESALRAVGEIAMKKTVLALATMAMTLGGCGGPAEPVVLPDDAIEAARTCFGAQGKPSSGCGGVRCRAHRLFVGQDALCVELPNDRSLLWRAPRPHPCHRTFTRLLANRLCAQRRHAPHTF